jgi:DNA repair exonuclease SbcCD ATPase subunit
MLKLKNYSFSGIGRFVQQQTVDLEMRDHLIQIDGENTNTGGSSGAGKSTTVEALAYLLGISEIASTQLQSRITKSPIWVQGEFEGGITITRSKKDGLHIKTPEGTVSGNSKLAEERLDEIIGVDRKLLKTMCYKRQKQGGFFLNLTPKESHNFLVECVDLKELQSKIFKLEDKLKSKYKPEKIRLEASIATVADTLDQFENLIAQKTMPEKPELPNIEEIKLKIDIISQKLESDKKRFNELFEKIGPQPVEFETVAFEDEESLQTLIVKTEELKKEIKQNEINKQVEVEQANSAIRNIEAKIKDAQGFSIDLVNCQTRMEELIHQKEHFDSDNCPTCKRGWKADSTSIEELEEKINFWKHKIDLLEEEVSKIGQYKLIEIKAKEIAEYKKEIQVNVEENQILIDLENSVRVLQNEKDNIQSVARQKYLEEFQAWKVKYDFAEKQLKEIETNGNYELYGLKSEIELAQSKKHSYETSVKAYHKDLTALKEKQAENSKGFKMMSENLAQIERDIVLSEESIRLIKNFTLQKFQDTLDYIGQRATEIINMIPNMANAVILFENAKETKTGKIKNEVSAVINLEGDVKVPIKTLSGGERTSADFAIDLAVGEMIENMTKKGVNFLVIDEGFDGLDSVSKIQCIEILKNLNTDKKILMVDHSSEVKEMVCDIIKVKRINEESFIQ